MINKRDNRIRRKYRIRARVNGTHNRPRLSVFRSNQALYVQLVDDEKHVILCAGKIQGKTIAKAKELGTSIAQTAKEKKITTVVFDRSGYRYHGVIKAMADAVREGGLIV
jgi:large subunit ribosomal protein L18